MNADRGPKAHSNCAGTCGCHNWVMLCLCVTYDEVRAVFSLFLCVFSLPVILSFHWVM